MVCHYRTWGSFVSPLNINPSTEHDGFLTPLRSGGIGGTLTSDRVDEPSVPLATSQASLPSELFVCHETGHLVQTPRVYKVQELRKVELPRPLASYRVQAPSSDRLSRGKRCMSCTARRASSSTSRGETREGGRGAAVPVFKG